MNLKVILSYSRLKMWSLGLVAFLLLSVNNGYDFEPSTLKLPRYDSSILRISYSRVQIPHEETDLIRAVKKSPNPKFKLNRKKIQRSFEAQNDFVPFVRTLLYVTFLDPVLLIHYEVPFFISQQASFIFRLSLF